MMNFTKRCKRSDFIQFDRFPPQIRCSSKKIRTCRDPFEGDPFKIQSLHFRYADKPIFCPISNRGKSFVSVEKSRENLKNLYYNHDHTISKHDKENLSLRHPRPALQTSNTRKSASVCALSVAPRSRSTEKELSSFIPMSESLNRDFLESGHDRRSNVPPITKKFDFSRSKSFITQPTTSMSSSIEASATPIRKRQVVKSKNTLDPKGLQKSSTHFNVDHNGSCQIIIKFDGIPTNQVSINKKDNNVEISLAKSKKLKKPKSVKALSPHELKPSRSYVISRDTAPSDVREDSHLRTDPPIIDLRDSSTHSMIPHKEVKPKVKVICQTPSVADTIRAYSGVRTNIPPKYSKVTLPSASVPKTSIPNRISESRVQILEKILSNNRIVEPRGRVLFTRSKSVLGQRLASSTIPAKYCFGKTNSTIY